MGNIFIGDSNSKARKVTNAYVGIDGKARKVKAVYVGDANGKARLVWNSQSALYGSVAHVSYNYLYLSRDYYMSTTAYRNENEYMTCICFSGDRFYIGADDGKIFSFKDGTFTTLYAPTNNSWYIQGIVGMNKNIVAHYSNTAVVSLDGGSTWSEHTIGDSSTGNIAPRGMICDGKQFLCISSSDGYLYTSPNGKTWTKGSYISTYYKYLFYANKRYYAAKDGAAGYQPYIYSTDSITWKNCSSSIGESWIPAGSDYTYHTVPTIDYINGAYTVVQVYPHVCPIGYSTDGITFTTLRQNYPEGGSSWNSVNCGDRIIAFETPFKSTGVGVWQTTDGINWSKISSNTNVYVTQFNNMAYANT